MEYRYLGNSGLKVSVLSFGVALLEAQADEQNTLEYVKAAYDLGCNFFDTAEVYANGRSETVFGEIIKKLGWKRSDIVVSTKLFWAGKGVNDRGLSRKHIIEGLRASLQRLQLDYVDLLYAHRPDVDTPMEETVRAFNWCIDQGLAFYWGTSEWSAAQIIEAHAVAGRLGLIGPLMEQPQYNMLHRERFEKEYAPLYKDYGLGTTIWSPLASGVLTGKYNKGVPEGSRLAIKGRDIVNYIRSEYLDGDKGRDNLAKIDKLIPIAKRLDCSLAQLALAWCIKNPNVSTVITGATRASQVRENFKALEVAHKLTPEVMAELDEILANKPVPDQNFRDFNL